MTQHPVAAICRTLRIARQTAYHRLRSRPAGFYRRADDETVLQQIRAVTNSRATYGYRRVWAMVNRTFRAGYNRKRIRRLMRMHDLMLPPRIHRLERSVWPSGSPAPCSIGVGLGAVPTDGAEGRRFAVPLVLRWCLGGVAPGATVA